MFEKSRRIVAEVEAHLLNTSLSEWRWLRFLQQRFQLPLSFVKLGVSENFSAAPFWSFTSFAFILVSAYFMQHAGLSHTLTSNYTIWIAMAIPLLMIIFALPSIYGTSGVKRETVEFVVQTLEEMGLRRPEDVSLLMKTIKPMEERSKRRLTTLWWLLGVNWAAFVYFLSKSLEPATLTTAQLISYNFKSSIVLVGAFAVYVLISGYESAISMLFRAIEFGGNDFCHKTDSEAESKD